MAQTAIIDSPVRLESVAYELPVKLEDLDSRLKAIVRLKLREFVHLSPFFRDVPLPDLSGFDSDDHRFLGVVPAEHLPRFVHRPVRMQARRRVVSPFLI